MSWNSRERVEQMIISLDSKSNFLKVVIQSLFLILVSGLLCAVLALTACAYSQPHGGLKQNSFRFPTPQVKEERNGSLDSSLIHRHKNQSLSLADTLPLWGKHPYVRFSGFTLGRPPEDDK